MPNFAYVKAAIACPWCGANFLDGAFFQWGYCSGSSGYLAAAGPDFVYSVGAPIHWRVCADSTILSWNYFTDGEANIGEPEVGDLLLRDLYHYGGPVSDPPCAVCGKPIGGTVVEIRCGVIVGVRAYRDSEFDKETDIYFIGADGVRQPKPEWNDRVMSRRDC